MLPTSQSAQSPLGPPYFVLPPGSSPLPRSHPPRPSPLASGIPVTTRTAAASSRVCRRRRETRDGRGLRPRFSYAKRGTADRHELPDCRGRRPTAAHRDHRREATIDACRLRLRPIMMTSLAFILGVVPLVVAERRGGDAPHARHGGLQRHAGRHSVRHLLDARVLLRDSGEHLRFSAPSAKMNRFINVKATTGWHPRERWTRWFRTVRRFRTITSRLPPSRQTQRHSRNARRHEHRNRPTISHWRSQRHANRQTARCAAARAVRLRRDAEPGPRGLARRDGPADGRGAASHRHRRAGRTAAQPVRRIRSRN